MSTRCDLEARVRAYAAAHTPALAPRRAVIAVSAGADSVATAALLCESGILDPAVCVVAHFDHALRGTAAAARDLEAVVQLSACYGLPLVTEIWPDPVCGEAAARQARYRFLARAAADAEMDVVVTGHTSNDQAETVVMHALRGAGLHGLRGMSPQSPWPLRSTPAVSPRDADTRPVRSRVAPALQLARPLLCVSTAETRAYCDARGLAYVDDATNDDTTLLRNHIRLALLPAIERVIPDARASLLRLADHVRDTAMTLDAIANRAIDRATVSDDLSHDALHLSRDRLRAVPATIAPYAWRAGVEQLLGDARDFDRRHYAVMSTAAGARTGASFELPRGLRLTVDAREIVLSIGAPPSAAIDPSVEHLVPFVGTIGGWWISVLPGVPNVDAPPGRSDAYELTFARVLSHDIAATSASARQSCQRIDLPPGAVVRGRRHGDRLQPPGMRGHKKLQDYYTDRKIPRRDRDAAPVIALGRDVLWTPFGARRIAG